MLCTLSQQQMESIKNADTQEACNVAANNIATVCSNTAKLQSTFVMMWNAANKECSINQYTINKQFDAGGTTSCGILTFTP
jgi:hypothetical protein